MKKCDNTKLKGDQLQDDRTHLAVWGLHHEDVTSMSNLKMIWGSALHSLVQLKARKTWPYTMP